MVGGAGEGGRGGSNNSNIQIGGNGGNFCRGGRRGHGGNMVGGAGEGGSRGSDNSNIHIAGSGRNIQIDIGGDDLNISTSRGRRGRGGNSGRGGGGIGSRSSDMNGGDRGSRRGGGSNINGGSKYQPRSVSTFSSPLPPPNSDFETNGDGRNIHGGGRRGRRVNINSSAIGEDGRNIEIDIGGDDLNVSSGRGRRGRGGNPGRVGGGLRSHSSYIDGGDYNTIVCTQGSRVNPTPHRELGASSADLPDENFRNCNANHLIKRSPCVARRMAHGHEWDRNSDQRHQPRASLEDVVQKYVLPAVLTLLQVTNLFNTEAAYMWTSFAAFLAYCMLLILNNGTVLVGQLKLVFGSLALVASFSIVIPSKLRHFALIIWAFLVILIIAHHMLKKSYQWIHCAAKQIIRRMMCMVQRPKQAQLRGLPV
ncbi:hypothetical protein Ancab_014368 [Ancistrocladus abbreviatus]